jgi:hypothetical protein
MMKRRMLLFICMIGIFSTASSQTIVQTGPFPEQWVQQMCDGIIAPFNVTISDNLISDIRNQFGGFHNVNSAIDLPYGAMIATGDIHFFVGPNTTYTSDEYSEGFTDSDQDLLQLVPEEVDPEFWNYNYLDFDFIATSDSIAFEYVFGSEEYNMFTTNYYDVFAILLSGPSISGPFSNDAINITTIPGTDISITPTHINNGIQNLGPCEYCEYFNSPMEDGENSVTGNVNEPYDYDPYYPNVDGYTNRMVASNATICGELYHVRILIANARDRARQSLAYIKVKSTESSAISCEIVNSQSGQVIPNLSEGCMELALSLSRPTNDDLSLDFSGTISLSGTAQFGVDYEFDPIEFIIPAGQNTILLPLNILSDALDEVESIGFVFEYSSGCAGTMISEFIYGIDDVSAQLSVNDQNFLLCEITSPFYLEPIIYGGSGNFSYSWESGETTYSKLISPIEAQDLSVTITDLCTGEMITASHTIEIFMDDYHLFLSPSDTVSISCGESVVLDWWTTGGYNSLNSLIYLFHEYTSFNNNTDSISLFSPTFCENYIIAEDACHSLDTASIYVLFDYPVLELNLPDTIFIQCPDSFVIAPEYISFNEPLSTSWYDQGTLLDTLSILQEQYNYLSQSTISFFVQDGCNQLQSFETVVQLEGGFAEGAELIYSDSILCENSQLILEAQVGDNSNLLWFQNGSPIENQNDSILEVTSTGTYYFVISSDVCDAVMTSDSVVVQTIIPVVSLFSYSSEGLEFSFTSNSEFADSVFWDLGDGATTSEMNPVHAYLNEGEFNVTLTAFNACGESTTSQVIMIVGLDEMAEEYGYLLYPNPADNQIHLFSKNTDLMNAQVYITDMLGNIVKLVASYHGGDILLDIESLSAGIYLLHLSEKSNNWSTKFLKVAAGE